MANWYDMGVGTNDWNDFTSPVTMDYSSGPEVGIGNSYAGYSNPRQAGKMAYLGQMQQDGTMYDPGTGYLASMDAGGAAPGPNAWMGQQRAAPYYPEPTMSNPGAPNMNDPWFSGQRSGAGSWNSPMGAPQPQYRGGGGYNINTSGMWNPVPIKSKYLDMLSQVMENPGAVESHPALKWIQKMGEQSLARSAGARRMRFAGKTGTDFINFGQGAASQYWNQLANTLQSAAGAELPYAQGQAQAKAVQLNQRMLTADPYGTARRAGMYNSPYDLPTPGYGAGGYDPYAHGGRAYINDRNMANWQLGRRLNQELEAAYG